MTVINEDFKSKIQGIISSSKSGPEKLGMILVNPLVVNYDTTIKDVKEMQGFLDTKLFDRVVVKTVELLTFTDKEDVAEKLKGDLQNGRSIKDGNK